MNEGWPKAIEDGLIPTDNAMGIMTEEPSPAAEPFIELAARASLVRCWKSARLTATPRCPPCAPEGP